MLGMPNNNHNQRNNSSMRYPTQQARQTKKLQASHDNNTSSPSVNLQINHTRPQQQDNIFKTATT